jgi:VWFA-related protein
VPVLLGQTPAATPPQQATFRARVDSVTVDVQVTDKTGKQVDDLTAEDFEVKEGKTVQTVDTFKLIKIDDNPNAGPPREILSFEAQAREAARDDTRLIVIFLDDYHTRRGNAMRVREQVARWISTLNDHDLVALAYPLTSPAALTFTYNHDGIAAAVAKFEGRKYDYTPKNAYEERYQMSPPELQEKMRNDLVVAALGTMCQYLGSMRDGRKTVLFVSEGMAGTIPPGISTSGSTAMGSSTTVGTSASRASRTRRRSWAIWWKCFARRHATTRASTRSIRAAWPARNSTSTTRCEPAGPAVLNESIDTLRTIASNTNGRAIVNATTPGPDLRQMIRDSSAYYLLATRRRSPPGTASSTRSRCASSARTSRCARKGYWATPKRKWPRRWRRPSRRRRVTCRTPDGLATAVAVRAASGARLAGTTRGDAGKTPSRSRGGGGGHGQRSRQRDRSRRGARDIGDGREAVRRSGHAIRGGAARAGIVKFDAPPGRVRLHVGETEKNVRVDADDRNVEVPDYTVPGSVITEPIVFRGRTGETSSAARRAAPIPTAARTFSRTERILVRFQAFGPRARRRSSRCACSTRKVTTWPRCPRPSPPGRV